MQSNHHQQAVPSPTSVELVDSLEAELRSYVLRTMPPDPSGELAAKPLGGLLIVFHNWLDRLIAPRPRTVHMSKELAGGPKAKEYAAALASIRTDIETGQDLTPRLSNGVNTGYTPTGQRPVQHLRADLDLLLADWGIHHLHLAPTGGGRTADLLFATFRPDDAYLIDVLPHGSWTDIRLLEVTVRNWPSRGLIQAGLPGMQLEQQFSPKERRDLRRAGIAAFVVIDGRVYKPRGQSMGGTPGDATDRSNQIVHGIWSVREKLLADPLAVDRMAEEAGASLEGHVAWEAYVDNVTIGFYSPGADVCLKLWGPNT